MHYKNVRKKLYRRQQQAISFSHHTEANIDKLLLGRFERLVAVRRFALSWIFFWVLLAVITGMQMTYLTSYFQTEQPIPGGIYSEGVLGTLTNVNPLYATSEVDASLSKLIFAGLFTYNNQNTLVGCLASGYVVDKSGTVYTVSLKPGLTWQDGKPLTANDVVYTFKSIQNPDAQSPLYGSWKGIKVSAPNALTVQFVLPNPLASFPYNLTVGIVPEHILGLLNPADLRSASFNTDNPIGSGPFSWQAIQVNGTTPENASEQIALMPFKHYVLGMPKLNEFIVKAYANKSQLLNAYSAGQLTALAGLANVPPGIKVNTSKIHSNLLTAGDYVFFKTNTGVLSDANVRRALVLASDPQAIINKLGYATIPVKEPLLLGQLGYNAQYQQITGNIPLAKQVLASDGWTVAKDGILAKNGQPLEFNLVTTNLAENQMVSKMLKKQWRAIGVKLDLVFESADTYSTTLQGHNYDSTLNGISIGKDPDVFVYWDSSQADPRSTGLNFSEYNNANASQALEAGRTRLNPALRVIKYQPFLADWQKDAPALGLYQPRSLYITAHTVYGLGDQTINSPSDRFDNVQNWEIMTANVTDPKS